MKAIFKYYHNFFFAKLRLNVLPDASVPLMVENVASLDAFVVLDRASTNKNLKQIIVYQCKRISKIYLDIEFISKNVPKTRFSP